MKREELISIYIPNYNYGRYLEKSILSAINQTYKNIEIIIIDDGSTDSSRKIIEQFSSNKKVKIIYQKNKGLNTTNNIAIKLSRGNFILRLDADDWLNKNAIQRLYSEIKKNTKIAMVYSDYYLSNQHGIVISQFKRFNFKNVNLPDRPAHGACSLIRKKYLLQVGGYNRLFKCQDGYDIWFKFLQKYEIRNINFPLFYYRQHSDSLSKKNYEILKTRAKILSQVSKKRKKLNIVAVIPIRGGIEENQNVSFKKLNNQNILDYSINSLLRSKVNKIIISTSDQELIKYINMKFKKYKRISIHKRSIEMSKINEPIKNTLKKIFVDLTKKKNFKFDGILKVSIEYPYRKSFYFNTMIDTMKIFNTDSVIPVLHDDGNIYQHTGDKLIPLNDTEKLKLERNEIYREVGGFYLLSKKIMKKNFFYPVGKIGHITVDDYAKLNVKNFFDINNLKKIKFFLE